jgi:bifunctional UDP-N-acetylglucosamine pyrophosphorylase/glucosamine-1-phosphate N-acetyltransferase
MSTPTPFRAVVLAAGEGKRMKSPKPKVLHGILGEPMLDLVLESLQTAGASQSVVVVGHGAAEVRRWLADRVPTAFQDRQLGTGHAARCGLSQLPEGDGYVVVTCGDVPLVTPASYRALVDACAASGTAAVILTFCPDDAAAYGRIVRDASGGVARIVEYKDASPDERALREVNSGIYCFRLGLLRSVIDRLTTNNAQGEYYLTDTIALLRADGHRIGAVVAPDWRECLGVNSPAELSQAEAVLQQRIFAGHIANGVRIENPATVRIGPRVRIGADSLIRLGSVLEGSTAIGDGCVVGPHSVLVNASLAPGTCLVGGHLTHP